MNRDKYAAAREAFAQGRATLAAVARAHGHAYAPMRKAALRQGWQALRDGVRFDRAAAALDEASGLDDGKLDELLREAARLDAELLRLRNT